MRDEARPALELATALPLDRVEVTDCVDPKQRDVDRLFAAAFASTLALLAPDKRRGALAGGTGHVESVTEVMLGSCGWIPVWHLIGPGRHGVDLLLIGPGEERLLAVEVKGTLRPGRWPHPSQIGGVPL